ncbi:putative disease resistance protein At4g11170, partial [Gastrolobium bilobum]|uniref:putative disease resistance protein At4g11170 n=1 Tax=Gastrolobium bilobum TaxID=150636 RepID=UPI002AAF3073
MNCVSSNQIRLRKTFLMGVTGQSRFSKKIQVALNELRTQINAIESRPVIMGNAESMDEPQDNFYRPPPSYAGSPVNNSNKSVTAKKKSGKAPQKKYDVFVSFRGPDIRHDFLSHLIDAFRRKQIYAFVDYKLERGDEISPSFFEAIETSLISLIIFSEDYASSHWCLEELEKIVECRDKYGQTVIPIFYNIDPTNVRHQKKSYGEALAEHEKKYNMTRVQTWRDALNKSANLSGIKSSDFRDEVQLLDEIIKTINHQLTMRLNKQPIQSKELVGIGKSIVHLESLLRQESKDVRVIGIWGMGGIGKTTIAQEIFNKLSSEYDGCCFLANVREELTRGSVNSLKEKLFSTILAQDVKINTANELPGSVMTRLGRIKVLIVLDDVNYVDHLKILVGGHDRFGLGSRIIVTTRNMQVLVAYKVDDDDIYEVGALEFDEALELFNFHAFKQNHLDMEYYELSKRVVKYAKGMPLVLKVLGHLLCGKDKEVWESQIDNIKRIPDKTVYDVMKLSYDDLDRKDKRIFLDLAYHASDNAVVAGLERLKDKALIIISKYNVVSVHDIIQEMAWEIVWHRSNEDYGSCSHLGDPNDVFEGLKYDKGSMAIRSIRAFFSQGSELMLSPHVFAKMSKLQFMDFECAYDLECLYLLPQELASLPTELRYLRWKSYPLKSLPVKFSAEKLVMLDLSYSSVEKLWDGVQNLVNLKEVNLSRSRLLKELPDFSIATNLEVLDISWCEKLTSVHIFSLHKLEELDVHCCSSLVRLTSDTRLNSLKCLNLETCHKLREFSVTSANMIELNLRFTCVDALPASFGHQSKLEILDLACCEIESFPSSIKNLTRLHHLNVDGCQKLKTLPELPPSLQTLLAKYCRSLETALFPSTATEQFNENRRRVQFWNCLNLVEHSLMAIELNAQINVMNLAHTNLSMGEHRHIQNYYRQAKYAYVYPGCRVPDWLEYKTTTDYVIIDLSSSPTSPPLGFIFGFIIGEKQVISSLKFNIIITDGEGEGNMGSVHMYMATQTIVFADSDHVCVLYDEHCSSYLNSKARTQTRFKIKVTVDSEITSLRIALKGFGVLIVLDDVNDPNQLEVLVGDHDWFGTGSRIIVTTRDKQVEEVYGVLKSKKSSEAQASGASGATGSTSEKGKKMDDRSIKERLQAKQSEEKFKRSGSQQSWDNERPLVPQCDNCGRHHKGVCLMGQNVCFKCARPGHYARDCPQIVGRVAHVQVVYDPSAAANVSTSTQPQLERFPRLTG